VVVVMHRREAITTSNTGRLVEQLLEGASVRVRGLREPPPSAPLPEGRRLALYPVEGARVLGPELAEGEPVVLLVPDGTWPQARRMVRRDVDLRDVEPVALPPAPSTHYGLRRRPREGALCTLEAIARALGVLEGAAVEERLIEALDHFVERSFRARGRRR
jgi:DTW domain-containing protein YfiP